MSTPKTSETQSPTAVTKPISYNYNLPPLDDNNATTTTTTTIITTTQKRPNANSPNNNIAKVTKKVVVNDNENVNLHHKKYHKKRLEFIKFNKVKISSSQLRKI